MKSIKGINWSMLRNQKEWLVEQANKGNNEEAEGLLSLLDNIMDEAVSSGIATEEEVFGVNNDNN
jgi:hypothetical protein